MKFIQAFIFGILAALGALVVELVISNSYSILSGKNIELDYYSAHLTFFLIIVVLTEEIFKYLMISKLYSNPTDPQRTISTALLAGSGFAFVELLLLHFNIDLFYLDSKLIGVFLLHLATAGMIGYCMLFKKNSSPLKILSLAFCLHIIYNLMVIFNLDYHMIFSYLVIILLPLAISVYGSAQANS